MSVIITNMCTLGFKETENAEKLMMPDFLEAVYVDSVCLGI